jgi:hypothetical protein
MIKIQNFLFQNDNMIEYWILNSNHVIKDIYKHFRWNKEYVIQLEIVDPFNFDSDYNQVDKLYIISDKYIFSKSNVSKMTFLKFIFDTIKQNNLNHKVFSKKYCPKWESQFYPFMRPRLRIRYENIS